jgi:hypothetical protein
MLFLLKAVLVPTLVASVTLASRRWGFRIGGILTALPMVAGPTLIFYAIEQGNAFAAEAARTALLGIVATSGFCVAYAHTSRWMPWIGSLFAGWIAVAILTAALYRLPNLARLGEFAIALGALSVGRAMIPRRVHVQSRENYPKWDVPLRMATSAAAVILFTGVASLLGPRLSGFVSALPVVTMILAGFTHAQHGHESVAIFLRGLLRGLHSFAVLCVAYAWFLGPLGWGVLPAFSTALAAQITLQVVLLKLESA